ncbi:DASH complex subunit Ask1p [Monosporozyma unispora]|nr:DASH complex subunit ask1 [Kazachstania unispora]
MDSQLEQLDQEIIHYLQKIDSNLNESFKIITQDIIPEIRQYGQHCDNIMDSCQWLVTMFEQTGNVQLFGDANGDGTDSIFPGQVLEQDANGSSSGNLNGSSQSNGEGEDDDFHTAKITTTGQMLKLPEFSDDDDDYANNAGKRKRDNEDKDADGSSNTNSTLQRQNRKRKASLLLQQQYGSNSSSIPSPVIQSKKRSDTHPTNNDESDGYESSPLRNEAHNSTILEFPTAE